MIDNLTGKLKKFIQESLLFPSYSVRKNLSFRYLRGSGLEIGALHHPLEVRPGVTVRYVDYATREENAEKFPMIDPARIVVTDYVEDGCELAGIPTAAEDFVIANHVLEHASNPVQALLNWVRVLKKEGVLFLTLPNGEKNFDQGRMITPVQHMVDDYDLVKSGDLETFRKRNREHYREFVEISIPNLHQVQRSLKTYETESARNSYIEKLLRESSDDAHFHVFSKKSLEEFLNYMITAHVPAMSLQEITSSRSDSEYVAVLKKNID
ncbi:methyltransferase domain-containing protein [Pelotalea chapellei]|uniref:Methyltransferase domain-containing protein n=1 Tax=Pelotalea chapellei TaxID=44671 RepID=A0ABS5UBY0_9BACT|nr:methyltransferase domain-containing protein [Pelotalea chapellei]MBT1073200.1 methyltransferase domain-containing protein [Pelotalea chapellei]